jgi:phage/plasmid-associated DNA primase
MTDYWLKSVDRRGIKRIIFDPGKASGYDLETENYNLWRGFSVEPVAGCWDKMKHHIYKIICRGDEELYEYVIMWMANIVQNPGGDRPGVCISLAGRKGTGKGTLADFFGRLFGFHYFHATSSDDVIGRFNSHLAQTVFLFADEAVFPGSKDGEGRLKGMITERSLAFEQKYLNKFTVDSHLNIMMASNEDWIFPASDEERRFLALELSEEHMQDFDYFKAIHQEMNEGGLAAMLYELMFKVKVDMGILRDVPTTTPLWRQIEQSERPVAAFWRNVNEDPEMVIPVSGIKLTKERVYRAYIKYCDDLKIGQYGRDSKIGFGRKSSKIFGDDFKKVYIPSKTYINLEKFKWMLKNHFRK